MRSIVGGAARAAPPQVQPRLDLQAAAGCFSIVASYDTLRLPTNGRVWVIPFSVHMKLQPDRCSLTLIGCLNLVNCLPREHNSVTFRRAEYFWPLGAKRDAGRKSADSPQHSDTSVLVNMCLYSYVSKPENIFFHFVVTFKNIKRLMEQDSSSLRNRHFVCLFIYYERKGRWGNGHC